MNISAFNWFACGWCSFAIVAVLVRGGSLWVAAGLFVLVLLNALCALR